VQSIFCEGEAGIDGAGLITMACDGMEVHPAAFVTVYVYVPEGMSLSVTLLPDPSILKLPGLRINVQFPVAGNPFITILPVEIRQVGCVMVPATGAEGVSFL
jgi:hypothetical protein